MVDIHSHILWGLDDGAESLEVSTAMLSMAAVTGTTDIVATPHANLRYHFDEGVVAERIRELQLATGGTPRIHRGCDFHLSFDNVQDALERPEKYTIDGGRYLLVEFPEAPLANMTTVLETLIRRGLIPIMTHPERHGELREIPKEFEGWIEMGCLVQVTAQSLLGRFGKRSEASAWEMVRRGIVHFVASDAHETVHRPPRLDEAFLALQERAGDDYAQRLFRVNPAAVIAGQSIERASSRRKRWFRFGR